MFLTFILVHYLYTNYLTLSDLRCTAQQLFHFYETQTKLLKNFKGQGE